jgi:PPOX class probable F420-dependent enzyme
MNSSLQQFQDQAYLNLETFRKNGTGVKTPVWFVEENGRFYVRTVADSWKVKRIRNNAQVKVVPCKSQGQPIGTWAPAQAHQINNPARQKEINARFNRKYGLQKRFFDLMGKLRKNQMTTLEIELSTDQ